MPEEEALPSTFNVLVVTAFVVVLLLYVITDMSVTRVKLKESFDRIEAKHIVHMAEYCLKKGKNYIELEKISDDDLEKCRIDAQVTVTDSITGNKKTLGSNWFGNRNHEIAVNIKAVAGLNPGWLRVEF